MIYYNIIIYNNTIIWYVVLIYNILAYNVLLLLCTIILSRYHGSNVQSASVRFSHLCNCSCDLARQGRGPFVHLGK